jgi:hypothetical protein
MSLSLINKERIGVYPLYVLFRHRKRDVTTTTAPIVVAIMVKVEVKPTLSMRVPTTGVRRPGTSIPAKKYKPSIVARRCCGVFPAMKLSEVGMRVKVTKPIPTIRTAKAAAPGTILRRYTSMTAKKLTATNTGIPPNRSER